MGKLNNLLVVAGDNWYCVRFKKVGVSFGFLVRGCDQNVLKAFVVASIQFVIFAFFSLASKSFKYVCSVF